MPNILVYTHTHTTLYGTHNSDAEFFELNERIMEYRQAKQQQKPKPAIKRRKTPPRNRPTDDKVKDFAL